MPKIRVTDASGNASYVPRGYTIGEKYQPVQWKLAGQYMTEPALQISAFLRSQGLNATAIQNSGGESIEARVAAAAIQYESIMWRGITPERRPDGVWFYAWYDYPTNSTQVCSGASPLEVIHKIRDMAHPIYQRLRDSLPEEITASATPPAIRQPAAPNTNGRMLRPADIRFNPADLPEQRISHVPVVREDFAQWTKTATAAQYKERCLSDAAFLTWANQN